MLKLIVMLKAAYPNLKEISSSDVVRFKEKYQSTLTSNQLALLDQLKQEIDQKYSSIAEDYGADIDALIVFADNDNPISASFLSGVKSELSNIPLNLRQTFRQEGYKIMPITDISKVASLTLLNEHPRGYPAGATYLDVPAYCDSAAKRVVIIELLQGRRRASPSDSLGHEVGHSMDLIYGRRVVQSAEENAKIASSSFSYLSIYRRVQL